MSQFAKKPKVVETFKQSYHKLTRWVPELKLPFRLAFTSPGTEVKAINVIALGHCTLDGKEMEFADVRIYMTTPPEQELPAHVERAIASEGGQGG